MRKKRIRQLIVIAGFLWLTFVYASFYLIRQQRPFGPANVTAFASTLLDILTAGSIALIGTALGRRVCYWLGVPLTRPDESIVLSTGVGVGAISFLVLGMGVLGWLTRPAIVILMGGLGLLTLNDLIAVLKDLRTLFGEMEFPTGLLRFYLLGMLGLTLLLALSPPIDWDGLFYHLTFPRLYIERGKIMPVTDVPHQYFPGLMEMLFTAAMVIKGDIPAKLIHFSYMLLLAGGIYLIADRHVASKYRWHAVTVYAAIPMVSVLGGWAYNDLALAFYQIVALYTLLAWFKSEQLAWLVLTAIFTGLAMGLKYTSFICPLSILAFITFYLLRSRSPARVWLRTFSIFLAVMAGVAAPWYIRNLAFTGNPTYPFAYDIFGGVHWDGWRAAWYARAGTGLGWDVGALLRLPWTLTLGIEDMNFYDGRVGPIPLLALPFLIAWSLRLFGRSTPRSPAVVYLMIFAFIQYVFWTLGVLNSQSLFQSRLLLPALAALSVPIAYVFDELRDLDMSALSLRRLLAISAALVLSANLCYHFLWTLRVNPLPVLVGEESRDGFLVRNLGAHYVAMQSIEQHVPPDGKVLFLWEPRSYYCQREVQPDAILERWAWLLHQHDRDLESIDRSLRNEGYTHILLHQDGMGFMIDTELDPLDEEDFAAWYTFASTYLIEETNIEDSYILFRLASD